MVKDQIVIGSKEYQLLEKHLKASNMSKFNNEKLEKELKNAKVVEASELPAKAIVLNSKVEIEETVSGRKFNFQVVLPNEANIKESKISLYTPMGAAVLGYMEGSFVEWEMPNGVQKFKINKVEQPEA
ncbi:transcription elongation factor GreA [Pelobium manganitolerans]|uniref:Transcription elongation factor GreA n=1 Tax=Pelobium manganitolerans TaxID=1842495 RepID=A0A419S425_9SPHI|nr:GreA/GreB family elongation factor [Pelobium manganitolerans]RKD14407.1 transcription elongation factor GreA [Pelobium manganitolerans]